MIDVLLCDVRDCCCFGIRRTAVDVFRSGMIVAVEVLFHNSEMARWPIAIYRYFRYRVNIMIKGYGKAGNIIPAVKPATQYLI